MELPSHYLITPKPEDETAFLNALERSLDAGIRLMQLRAKGMSEDAYRVLAEKAVAMAHDRGCRVLLNGDPALVQRLGADGLHLDSGQLASCTERPLPSDYLVAVSGHSLDALNRGETIGADFGVLSPVRYTKAHPDIEPLGWEGLQAVTAALDMPVYGLGGVSADDEAEALRAGAQGVAGNKGYWKAPTPRLP